MFQEKKEVEKEAREGISQTWDVNSKIIIYPSRYSSSSS